MKGGGRLVSEQVDVMLSGSVAVLCNAQLCTSAGTTGRVGGATAEMVFVTRRLVPQGGIGKISKYLEDNKDQLSCYWKKEVQIY